MEGHPEVPLVQCHEGCHVLDLVMVGVASKSYNGGEALPKCDEEASRNHTRGSGRTRPKILPTAQGCP